MNNEWETPDELYGELDAEFGFTLDPCATHENARCEKHYTIVEDGLSQNWGGEVVFMNPPYSNEIRHWARKAYLEALRGTTVVCLVPSNTDTGYWHDYFMKADDIRYVRGRIKFSGHTVGAPFASSIVIFRGWIEKSKKNRLSERI